MLRETIRSTDSATATQDDRSLGELFAELSRETSQLVRSEVALAKTELSHKAVEVGKDIGFLLGGAAIVYAGFLALIATVIVGLAQAGITWWVAALIVGLLVTAGGAYLLWMGINDLRQADLAPRQTIEALKEDPKWTGTRI